MLVRKDLRGSLASDGAILASLPANLRRYLYKPDTDEFRPVPDAAAARR
jgi:hypothetical protein